MAIDLALAVPKRARMLSASFVSAAYGRMLLEGSTRRHRNSLRMNHCNHSDNEVNSWQSQLQMRRKQGVADS